MKHILLMKAGQAATAVRLTVGDYDQWFLRTIGLEGVRFTLVQTALGEEPKDPPKAFDAVMMTGSPLSATAPTEWMKRAAGYLLEGGEQRVPVLGVCFGLQLLGLGLGVNVVRNPRGRELGTVEVKLTDEGAKDPLFEGVPGSFATQTTHEDVLERVPDGATLLATNAQSPVQALAIGRYVRGVQFHPELDAAGMQAVIEARADKLALEAEARGEAGEQAAPRLKAGLRPTPFSHKLLRNFVNSLE
jgi:GMP synthase (glutamine-hydrolysing)